MAEDTSAKVRQLISAYERQSSSIEPLEPYEGRKRAKSIGNALSYKQFYQPLEINSILDIEKELVKIEAHLNYYEIYDKETHVAFQEQLFNILTCIVSIDPEGQSSTVQKKKSLIAETQKLARVLNLKLPLDGSSARSYTSIRKQEDVVSTTGLQSITDSDSTVDTSPTEAVYTPSVSKLKKFFSFRRDNVQTSSVSRTQSLNLKTTRPAVVKKQETIEEVTAPAASTPIVHVEPTREIEEHSHNVSVSKLKSMFEERKKESDEGLGLLTKNDFVNLPYEVNLAFGLNRKFSGSYMNMTYMGMLRNVDIQKRVDMNKSKSMSDLKMHDLSEELDDVDVDDLPPVVKNDSNNNDDRGVVRNLTKTFEHISVHEQLRSGTEEEVNADLKHILHRKVEPHELTFKEPQEESFVVGMVGSLKHSFEQISHQVEEPVLKVPVQFRTFPVHAEETAATNGTSAEGSKIVEHPIKVPGPPVDDEEINGGGQPQEETIVVGMVGSLKHTFEKISNKVDEPVLKVPTQPAHVQESGEDVEDVNADIKHILHRTVEPHHLNVKAQRSDDDEGQPQEEPFVVGMVGSLKHTFEQRSNQVEEPVLKVPVQFRTFPVHAQESGEGGAAVQNENVEVNAGVGLKEDVNSDSRNLNIEANGVEEQPQEESSVVAGTVGSLKNTFEQKSHQVEEPVLKVPVQFRTFPVQVEESGATELNGSSISEDASVKEVVETGAEEGISVATIKSNFEESTKVEEPVLKVPIQMRLSPVEVGASVETSFVVSSKEAKVTEIGAAETELNGSRVSVDVLKNNFEESGKVVPVSANARVEETTLNGSGLSVEILKSSFETSNNKLEESGLKVPNQINGGDVVALKTTFESPIRVTSSSEQKVWLKVPIDLKVADNAATYYNVSTESIEAESGVSSSRAQIERTSRGLMKILESPTSFSTLTSTSNHSLNEVTDSMSYSETSFSSTKISQRITTTSTSSSSKLQSVSIESHGAEAEDDDEDSGVTIEEIDDSDKFKKSVHLSDSQENILDEVLNDTNGHNIDEEFEKMF